MPSLARPLPPPTPRGSCGLELGADRTQGLPWQAHCSTFPVAAGSSQSRAEPEPPAEKVGRSPVLGAQRDGEAYMLQRPGLWVEIEVLQESGRGILEGSLEKVRLKGLYWRNRESK